MALTLVTGPSLQARSWASAGAANNDRHNRVIQANRVFMTLPPMGTPACEVNAGVHGRRTTVCRRLPGCVRHPAFTRGKALRPASFALASTQGTSQMASRFQRITPFLWFDDQAEPAV